MTCWLKLLRFNPQITQKWMVYPALTCVHTDVFPVPLHVLTSQECGARGVMLLTAWHNLPYLPKTTQYARGLQVFKHFSRNLKQKPNIKFNRNPFSSLGWPERADTASPLQRFMQSDHSVHQMGNCADLSNATMLLYIYMALNRKEL